MSAPFERSEAYEYYRRTQDASPSVGGHQQIGQQPSPSYMPTTAYGGGQQPASPRRFQDPNEQKMYDEAYDRLSRDLDARRRAYENELRSRSPIMGDDGRGGGRMSPSSMPVSTGGGHTYSSHGAHSSGYPHQSHSPTSSGQAGGPVVYERETYHRSTPSPDRGGRYTATDQPPRPEHHRIESHSSPNHSYTPLSPQRPSSHQPSMDRYSHTPPHDHHHHHHHPPSSHHYNHSPHRYDSQGSTASRGMDARQEPQQVFQVTVATDNNNNNSDRYSGRASPSPRRESTGYSQQRPTSPQHSPHQPSYRFSPPPRSQSPSPSHMEPSHSRGYDSGSQRAPHSRSSGGYGEVVPQGSPYTSYGGHQSTTTSRQQPQQQQSQYGTSSAPGVHESEVYYRRSTSPDRSGGYTQSAHGHPSGQGYQDGSRGSHHRSASPSERTSLERQLEEKKLREEDEDLKRRLQQAQMDQQDGYKRAEDARRRSEQLAWEAEQAAAVAERLFYEQEMSRRTMTSEHHRHSTASPSLRSQSPPLSHGPFTPPHGHTSHHTASSHGVVPSSQQGRTSPSSLSSIAAVAAAEAVEEMTQSSADGGAGRTFIVTVSQQ